MPGSASCRASAGVLRFIGLAKARSCRPRLRVAARSRVREAMQAVHCPSGVQARRFPNDTAVLVAQLAADGSINSLRTRDQELRAQLGDSGYASGLRTLMIATMRTMLVAALAAIVFTRRLHAARRRIRRSIPMSRSPPMAR